MSGWNKHFIIATFIIAAVMMVLVPFSSVSDGAYRVLTFICLGLFWVVAISLFKRKRKENTNIPTFIKTLMKEDPTLIYLGGALITFTIKAFFPYDHEIRTPLTLLHNLLILLGVLSSRKHQDRDKKRIE